MVGPLPQRFQGGEGVRKLRLKQRELFRPVPLVP